MMTMVTLVAVTITKFVVAFVNNLGLHEVLYMTLS